MRVFITGFSGFLGQRLTDALISRGDQVVGLSRRPPDQAREGLVAIVGDPTQPGPWLESLTSCDAVIHLAGENIFAKRWSKAQKERLVKSRVDSGRLLAARLSPRQVMISASGIGFYGARGDEICSETTASGEDFLARVCVEWESAAHLARGSRVVILRFGLILGPDGGAFPRLRSLYQWGLGGTIGTGQQWLSWIHVADAVRLVLAALDQGDWHGAVNATSPGPVRQRQFAKLLGSAMGRPTFLFTPGWALRVALGEVASVLTTGQRVTPDVALSRAFRFQHPTLSEALAACIAGKS